MTLVILPTDFNPPKSFGIILAPSFPDSISTVLTVEFINFINVSSVSQNAYSNCKKVRYKAFL